MCMTFLLFLTIPVTVVTAESSFVATHSPEHVNCCCCSPFNKCVGELKSVWSLYSLYISNLSDLVMLYTAVNSIGNDRLVAPAGVSIAIFIYRLSF